RFVTTLFFSPPMFSAESSQYSLTVAGCPLALRCLPATIVIQRGQVDDKTLPCSSVWRPPTQRSRQEKDGEPGNPPEPEKLADRRGFPRQASAKIFAASHPL